MNNINEIGLDISKSKIIVEKFNKLLANYSIYIKTIVHMMT